jgi:hypothetical protein
MVETEDEVAKPLNFKDFLAVDYAPGQDGQISKNAKKRKQDTATGNTGESKDPFWAEDSEQNEVLSFQGRRALARAMKRNKSRMKMARKRSMQKSATKDTLMKRATKQARNQLFKKFSKDASRGDLTPQRRGEIEKRVGKMKTRVSAIARKLLHSVRQTDKDRKS